MEKVNKSLTVKELVKDFVNCPIRATLKSLLRLNIAFVMLSITCLAISSILTFIMGFVEFLHFFDKIHHVRPNGFNAMICKVLETNLIGVILFICAAGLYSLFWKDIRIPTWIQLKDINQLKEKLVGIIITVLGVNFLEHALEWGDPKKILMFGGAISMVIIVLVFYSKVLSSEKATREVENGKVYE